MRLVTKIRLLRVGRMSVPGPEVFWMERFGETLPLTLWMVVIETSDRTILINTGVPADDAVVPELFDRIPGGSMAGLQRIGVEPNQVTDVVVTPLQAYAIGNADQFPMATIHLSRRGWIDYHAPPRPTTRETRERAIPWSVLSALSRAQWPNVHLLNDEDTIVSDAVSVSWMGCHHRSSLAIWVETSAGIYAFTDVVFHRKNLEANKSLGIGEDRYECLEAYHRLTRRADYVIGLYDPVWERECSDGVLFFRSATSI